MVAAILLLYWIDIVYVNFKGFSYSQSLKGFMIYNNLTFSEFRSEKEQPKRLKFNLIKPNLQ